MTGAHRQETAELLRKAASCLRNLAEEKPASVLKVASENKQKQLLVNVNALKRAFRGEK